jgi:hypothetical protein
MVALLYPPLETIAGLPSIPTPCVSSVAGDSNFKSP